MTAELNMILRLKLSSPSEDSERLKSRVKLVYVKFFFFFLISIPHQFLTLSGFLIGFWLMRARERALASRCVWSGSRWGDIPLLVTRPALEQGEPEVKEATTIPQAFI